MKTVDVGIDFYPRLANRDSYQGDGAHTAVEFRKKFLEDLDSNTAWNDDETIVTLDFKNVRKIGPSFANEAFAYFARYTEKDPNRILKKIKLENISEVKKAIILEEVTSGYNR